MKLLKILIGLNGRSKVTLIIGILIIGIGVYFSILDLTSSGVQMGESGEPYGTGTIDGKGIVFCGIVFIVIGLVTFNTKIRNN